MAKATRKQALGRGLSALLKDPEHENAPVRDLEADPIVGSIVELEMDTIIVNPFQPRSNFNEETLRELASSIRELGVIQPITVRKSDSNIYQLVSGERRYRASRLVGLSTIPAYIRIANDQESLEMALVENIQRQDLDPIEIALSYQRLIDEIEVTQEKLSERVGKKRSTITNYLRLLRLDPIIQSGIRDGFISMGHGRTLVTIESKKDQLELYEKILGQQLSVRETENLVKGYQHPDRKEVVPASVPPSTMEFTTTGKRELTEFLQTDVRVTSNNKGKGSITIPFATTDEFHKIKKRITGE